MRYQTQETTIEFEPLPWQRHALDTVDANAITYMSCGLGSGKTMVGAALTAKYTSTLYGKTRGLVIAPTYPMLRDATMQTFMEHFRPFVAEHNKTDRVTTTLSGSEILWRSGSDPDSLRGPNIDWAWIDEAAITSEDLYLQVLSRLRRGDIRKLWMTTTPNAVKGAWLRRLTERTPEIKRIYASTADNTQLPQDYIQRLEESFTSDYAQQELHGKDIDVSGPVMNLSWIQREGPWVRDDAWTICIGIDLAISTKASADFRANVVTAHNQATGQYKVVDITHGRWSFHEHVREVQRLITKWNPQSISVEDVAYQHVMIEELRRVTTTPINSYRPGTRDKLTRFQPWAGKYELGLITHCGPLPEELDLELEVFPSSRHHDDLIDALVISLEAHVPQMAGVVFL